MDKIRVSLTSKGYKCVGIVGAIGLLIFFIVLVINFQEIPLYAIIFVFFVFLFALFACILCFTHRIVVDTNKGLLIVANLTKKEVSLKEVIDIKVNNQFSINPKKFCNIEILLKDNRIIKIPGYSSILKRNDTDKTKKIVEKVKVPLNFNNV